MLELARAQASYLGAEQRRDVVQAPERSGNPIPSVHRDDKTKLFRKATNKILFLLNDLSSSK